MDGLTDCEDPECRFEDHCECVWDCEPTPNGSVGTSDLLTLLGQWGGPTFCDFDGDGVAATFDLLELLANWGPCDE